MLVLDMGLVRSGEISIPRGTIRFCILPTGANTTPKIISIRNQDQHIVVMVEGKVEQSLERLVRVLHLVATFQVVLSWGMFSKRSVDLTFALHHTICLLAQLLIEQMWMQCFEVIAMYDCGIGKEPPV